MPATILVYRQLFDWMRQHCRYQDLRHLTALTWMVLGLIGSERLNLTAWEAHVRSRAQQAQSYQRRWHRFLVNPRIRVLALYVPLLLAALQNWQGQRLYLALDTTVLWNRFCMVHLSVVCCGRAVPLLWKVLEHKSAAVAFPAYRGLLHLAQRILHEFPDVMLLADRGFANQDLLRWLQRQENHWHYCLRLPCDVAIHGPYRHPVEVRHLWPSKGEARLLTDVRLWTAGLYRSNLALANVRGAREPWAVITDEPPSLQTFHQYSLRFDVEELFLDSKSGAFDLTASRLRSAQTLKRLYLVVAVVVLWSTCEGLAVQVAGLRRQVDPHWRRGLSYLKIGLAWLRGVLTKGRPLVAPLPLLAIDPEPCFASKKARRKHDNQIWFSRIRSLRCHA